MPVVRTLRPTENPESEACRTKNGILRKGSLEHTNRERRFRRYDADSGTRSLERRRMIWRLNPLVGNEWFPGLHTDRCARGDSFDFKQRKESLPFDRSTDTRAFPRPKKFEGAKGG